MIQRKRERIDGQLKSSNSEYGVKKKERETVFELAEYFKQKRTPTY